MLKIKIYKYDSTQESNGYRGTDYSDYVLQGFQDTEDITQELDTSEITLCGLTQSKEFDPETKFIIQIVDFDIENGEIIQNTLHRVVSRDIVSQPILSDDTYYDHHISFIEPSVIAQKRLVDNISATYKLKDVTLKQDPYYPEQELVMDFTESGSYVPSRNFGKTISGNDTIYISGKYFEKDGDLVIKNENGDIFDNIYTNIESFNNGDNTYTAYLTLPKISIMFGNVGTKTFSNIGHASLQWTIKECDLSDENNITNTYTGTIISKDNLGQPNIYTDAPFGYDGLFFWQDKINGEWLLEDLDDDWKTLGGITTNYYYLYYKKYTNTSPSQAEPNYNISIPVHPNKIYKIEISPYQFDDNIPSVSFQGYAYAKKYTGNLIGKNTQKTIRRISSIFPSLNNTYRLFYNNTFLSEPQSVLNSSFSLFSGSSIMMLASSIPYSALALLQKAILNSSLYEKKENVNILDVNNSDLPFVIDENYLNKLATTKVIENFYNQKNLWEIMLEVGHYIHAIPELKFGADDKFEITFNELGRTDQHIDNTTKVSIYNSRSVEDYISATSSYVSNMVQLGGYIEEWVTPKTSDDTLLIANDTANLITSKPIIELLEIKVKSNITQTIGGLSLTAGQIADVTPFIFEENVYKTLPIDYTIVPNRGIAMYYQLGSKEIMGGQYRLPQANYNVQNDYTIKKIIYCAYSGYSQSTATSGLWTDLKVNDFSFYIKYRTKSEVRQNHIRPDLRKYLLNSKHDNYPEHNQFNNQQDILVDSIKFGNNVYGKLIKTGNSEYTKQEWLDNFDNVKHKGELYNINGSLYYVSKVTNIYYADHIESEVKFSKDYNELSAVIGIPSEPRFYEISEQSSIKREVAINQVILLTDDTEQSDFFSGKKRVPDYLYTYGHLNTLLFGNGGTFAKYALTSFKGDKDLPPYNQTTGQSGFYKEIFTPINAYSSENTLTYEWDMVDNFSAGDKVIPTEQSGTTSINSGSYNSLKAVQYTDVYGKAALFDFYILKDINLGTDAIKAQPDSPVSAVGTYLGEFDTTTMPTDAELAQFLLPVRPLGVTFGDIVKVVVDDGVNIKQIYRYIYTDDGWEYTAVPSTYDFSYGTFLKSNNTPIIATNKKSYNLNLNGEGLGLLKDCREIISFNYNLQMITDSDTFVLSPFLFLPNKQNIKVVLLSEEVNKFTDGYIDESKIVTPLDNNNQTLSPYFNFISSPLHSYSGGWGTPQVIDASTGISFDPRLNNVNEHHFDGTDGYDQVKAIAIICDVNQSPSTDTSGVDTIVGKKQFVIARNIPSSFTKQDAIKEWFLVPPTLDYFTNKQ